MKRTIEEATSGSTTAAVSSKLENDNCCGGTPYMVPRPIARNALALQFMAIKPIIARWIDTIVG